MADTNVSKLFASLLKMQDNVITIMESAEELSKTASLYNGEIARVLPLNLKSVIDKLSAILEGGGQDSLSGLVDFLDNIPLSEIRDKPISERRVDTQALGVKTPPAPPAVNTRPNTASGPQSAVLKESAPTISKYLKEEYAPRPAQALRERGKMSFADMLADGQLGIDLEDTPDVISSVDIPTEQLARLSPHANDFAEEEEFGAEPVFVDEFTGGKMESEPVEIADWRNIARSTNGASHEDLARILHESEGVRPMCGIK
jgi:hypothetical protein